MDFRANKQGWKERAKKLKKERPTKTCLRCDFGLKDRAGDLFCDCKESLFYASNVRHEGTCPEWTAKFNRVTQGKKDNSKQKCPYCNAFWHWNFPREYSVKIKGYAEIKCKACKKTFRISKEKQDEL